MAEHLFLLRAVLDQPFKQLCRGFKAAGTIGFGLSGLFQGDDPLTEAGFDFTEFLIQRTIRGAVRNVHRPHPA